MEIRNLHGRSKAYSEQIGWAVSKNASFTTLCDQNYSCPGTTKWARQEQLKEGGNGSLLFGIAVKRLDGSLRWQAILGISFLLFCKVDTRQLGWHGLYGHAWHYIGNHGLEDDYTNHQPLPWGLHLITGRRKNQKWNHWKWSLQAVRLRGRGREGGNLLIGKRLSSFLMLGSPFHHSLNWALDQSSATQLGELGKIQNKYFWSPLK